MGELGEALRLMHGARDSFRTVRATIRERHDRDLGRRAWERFRASAEGWGDDFEDPAEERAEELPRVAEEIVRLWVEQPDRVRTEAEGDARTAEIGVSDGRRWWHYDPEDGLTSNEDDLSVHSGIGERLNILLDPAGLLAALTFEPRGHTTVAHRDAILLRATPRAGVQHEFDLHQLALGADEYEFAVDVERGILLRAASLIEGEEFAVQEILDVAFDEEFSPDTFMLTAPPGEVARGVWEPEARDVTIKEAARLAPFSVWFPARVPAAWRVEVGYFPGDEQHREPAAVGIHLSRADALHRITIEQQASGLRDPEDPYEDTYERWVERDWRGETVKILEREHGPNNVRLEREGTRITLVSDLGADWLLELAGSLQRIGGG
jgi:outer membrane lipoprotein-sorting protein